MSAAQQQYLKDRKNSSDVFLYDDDVSDAGGGQFPARLSESLQRPGSSAADTPSVAAAVTQPRLRPLHPAQRAGWGENQSIIPINHINQLKEHRNVF